MEISNDKKIPLNFLMKTNNHWEISEDLFVTLSVSNYDGEQIVIPKGFRTDLASVPRIFHSVINTYGDFIIAAIIHDWLYKTDYKRDLLGDYEGRLMADREMRIWSEKYNSNRFENTSMFWGVRLFGARIYKRTPEESEKY